MSAEKIEGLFRKSSTLVVFQVASREKKTKNARWPHYLFRHYFPGSRNWKLCGVDSFAIIPGFRWKLLMHNRGWKIPSVPGWVGSEVGWLFVIIFLSFINCVQIFNIVQATWSNCLPTIFFLGMNITA